MKKLISLIFLLILIGLGLYMYNSYQNGITLDEAIAPIKDLVEQVQEFSTTVIRDEKSIPFELSVNENLSSPIALLGKSTTGEGFAVLTKTQNGTEQLDQIILSAADDSYGVLDVDQNGLPTKFSFNGAQVTFSNYTETTVDLTVTNADGGVKTIESVALNLPEKEQSLSFIPFVHAAESLGEKPRVGQSRASGDDASFVEYITSSAGTALNILTCSVALASVVGTGGASGPFAYLPCAPLATRLTTNYINVFDCDRDIIDCAVLAIKDSFRQKGPSIGGVITDALTGNPVQRVSIVVTDKQGRVKARSVSAEHGHYLIPVLDLGAYTITVSSPNHESQSYILATTETRIQISGEKAQSLDAAYNKEERSYFKKIPGYYGLELNQSHHIRFDISLGESGMFDGVWNGTALSSQEFVPDPSDPNSFTECASASFSWTIDSGSLTGSALVDNDYTVNLTGSVDANGTITAGSGLSFVEQVTFTGKLKDGLGSGTWSGTSGCSGAFTAEQELSPPQQINEVAPVF